MATPWAIGVGVTSTDVTAHINIKDIVRVLSTRQRGTYNGYFSNGQETWIAGTRQHTPPDTTYFTR